LHIEAYHSQINNQKEKQRIKTSKEISKHKRKIKGKTVILFKERRRKQLHIINTLDSRKIEGLKCKSDQN
jgi:hypothetical protein